MRPRPRTILAAAALLVLTAVPSAVRAQHADRVERRSEELALPDTYLDPSWPDDPNEQAISPSESDSVEDVPLDDEKPDAAEAEEAERYREEMGQAPEPDEMRQDQMGAVAGRPDSDDEEARDPAQW